jgi:NADPH:quinone reductase
MGSPMVIHSGRDPAIRIPRLESIFGRVAEGQITPSVSDVYDLADFRVAMHAKMRGRGSGHCVLHFE